MGLSANWETDIWCKVAHSVEAASANQAASAADLAVQAAQRAEHFGAAVCGFGEFGEGFFGGEKVAQTACH